MPTYLMSDCKRSVKAVVLDDGTASLRRADGADVRHAKGVAGVVATEVLDKGNTVSTSSKKKWGKTPVKLLFLKTVKEIPKKLI